MSLRNPPERIVDHIDRLTQLKISPLPELKDRLILLVFQDEFFDAWKVKDLRSLIDTVFKGYAKLLMGFDRPT